MPVGDGGIGHDGDDLCGIQEVGGAIDVCRW